MKMSSLVMDEEEHGGRLEEAVALQRWSVQSTDERELGDMSDGEEEEEEQDWVSDFSGSDKDVVATVDGGREAWKVLVAAWALDFMTSGVWVSFGLFQSSYLSNPLFMDSAKSIPAIGSLLSGVSWLATPLTNALVLRYISKRMQMLWIGWILCILGLIGASFATHVWHLHLFQGITYGAGWVIYWSPLLVIINEHWVDRRGLAYGLWFTASNASGLAMPFVIQKLLERFDFRVTLRLYAFACILIAGPAVRTLQSRPAARIRIAFIPSATRKKPIWTLILPPRHLFTNLHFLLFTLAILLQSFVNYIPNIYLPSFAESLSLRPTAGSSLLALSSIATIAGQLFFGFSSDMLHPYVLTSLSTLVCSMSTLFVKNATRFQDLAAFSFLWGFFAGPFDVLFAKICAVLTSDPDEALILYGFLSAERGVAVLAEGFVAVGLVAEGEEAPWKYARLLGLCAWCMLGSAMCGAGWIWKGRQR